MTKWPLQKPTTEFAISNEINARLEMLLKTAFIYTLIRKTIKTTNC